MPSALRPPPKKKKKEKIGLAVSLVGNPFCSCPFFCLCLPFPSPPPSPIVVTLFSSSRNTRRRRRRRSLPPPFNEALPEIRPTTALPSSPSLNSGGHFHRVAASPPPLFSTLLFPLFNFFFYLVIGQLRSGSSTPFSLSFSLSRSRMERERFQQPFSSSLLSAPPLRVEEEEENEKGSC